MRQAWFDVVTRSSRRNLWKAFPVRNVKRLEQPHDFREYLCEKLRNAQSRIYLCTLYIGPYADPQQQTEEGEFLQALSEVPPNVDIKVLMDKSRGERKIPFPDSSSTSSAEVCRSILGNDRVFLFPLLPTIYQRLLPNPYNEIAGVFHVKLYIVDDECIISGANLSQEYFRDRHDRYLVIQDDDLVAAYSKFADSLCKYTKSLNTKELSSGISDAFLDRTPPHSGEKVDWSDESIQAYAVPTFQMPMLPDLPSDAETTASIVRNASSIRLASAYFNPTSMLTEAWSDKDAFLMTAGPLSHGFKPKAKVGNKGKAWIPQVYHELGRNSHHNLWYYNREDWTFHAKGLWLSPHKSSGIEFKDEDDIIAVAHGSGNYGMRSQFRDMESNLFLFLPEHSNLISDHKQEWNEMCQFASRAQNEDINDLDPLLKFSLPAIKSFF